MNARTIIAVFAVVGVAICIAMLRSRQRFPAANLLPPAPAADEMYPRPTNLSPATAKALAGLLSEYENVIRELNPGVYAALQPGLSVEQLDAFEVQHDIVLTTDIRTLYSWKNGSSDHTNAFPFYKFVPLGEALDSRKHFRKGTQDKPPEIQEVYHDWLAFRYSWLCVLDNQCGDGYFYDPDRREEASSFFYTCHDDVGYMFYPSIGNYIEELLELHRRKELSTGKSGIEQDSDRAYDEEKIFLNQFGQWVP